MDVSDARFAYHLQMPRTRGIALVLVGVLIIVSDTLDAIDDGLSGCLRWELWRSSCSVSSFC